MRIETIKDAREAAELLAASFEIPAPRVVVGHGRISRCVRDGTVTLVISPRDWHGIHDATLHEFAHALHYHEERRGGRCCHDKAFYLALVRVLRTWAGGRGLEAYRWDREYKGIYLRARADGLTRLPHFRHERDAKVKRAKEESGLLVGMRVSFRGGPYGLHQGVVVSLRGTRRARVQTAYCSWLVPYHRLLPLE
jgi:hypothetical protein